MSRSKPHGGLILHVSPVEEGSAEYWRLWKRRDSDAKIEKMSHRWHVQLSTLVSWDFWLEGHWGLCHVKLTRTPWRDLQDNPTVPLRGPFSRSTLHSSVQQLQNSVSEFSLREVFLCFSFFFVGNVLDTHPCIKSVINLVTTDLQKWPTSPFCSS